MKRRNFLTSLTASALALIFIATNSSLSLHAQDKDHDPPKDAKTALIGTWILDNAANPGNPSGIGTRLKMFTGTHWCIVQPDPDTGRLAFQHGGTYTFDGKRLKETIDFAGESTLALVGQTFTHELAINDDLLEQIAVNSDFNETWRRAKPEAKESDTKPSGDSE